MNKYIRTFFRNLFTITGTWELASSLRRSKFADKIRYKIHRQHIFINKNSKIVFPHVDIYLTKSCNLKCEHCSSFNPLRSGIYSKEFILNSINQWSARICPQTILLLGGEPLLHPEYEEIVLTARNAWKQSSVIIITNGLLLPKVRDEFLKLMSENTIEFRISKHIDTENYNKHLKEAINRLKQLGVKYEIVESHKSWISCHSLNADGVPLSPNSIPQKSWTGCLSKYCIAISGNQLCRCSIILNMIQAVTEKILPIAEFKEVCNHKLVSIEDSNEKILRYLHEGVLKECRFCPENFINIEAKQIPSEKLQYIQNIITEMNCKYTESETSPLVTDNTCSCLVE
jgi:organic radical activating enzyme